MSELLIKRAETSEENNLHCDQSTISQEADVVAAVPVSDIPLEATDFK